MKVSIISYDIIGYDNSGLTTVGKLFLFDFSWLSIKVSVTSYEVCPTTPGKPNVTSQTHLPKFREIQRYQEDGEDSINILTTYHENMQTSKCC